MANNTINKEEIEKFSKLAEEWWDPEGKFKPLHKFNPIRINYIKNCVINEFNIRNKKKPFSNLEMLDIGCGGGLLTEPMARLGGKLTGIDASDKNINIAKIHAKKNNLKINYICSSPEKLKTNKKFDVILNMEIVEHVANVDLFIYNLLNIVPVAYQAVSGSGSEAVNSLIQEESLGEKLDSDYEKGFYDRPIARNVIPLAGNLTENGYSDEEMKEGKVFPFTVNYIKKGELYSVESLEIKALRGRTKFTKR